MVSIHALSLDSIYASVIQAEVFASAPFLEYALTWPFQFSSHAHRVFSENLVVFEANGAASSSSSSSASSSSASTFMLRAEEPEDDAAAGSIVRTRTYDLHIVYVEELVQDVT